MRHLLFIALISLLVGGCGTVADPTEWFASAEVEPVAELENLENVISPKVIWTRDIGQGADDQRLSLRPWIDSGRIYVADSAGAVQAMDAATGNVLWSVDTELPISGGPGVGDGLVLVGTLDAEVIALDQATGSERWRKEVSSEILSTPVASLGTVVVHANDGKLFGLDSTTGEQRWLYDRSVPVLTLRGSGSPVINGSTVYCGLAGGKLVALSLTTGQPEWAVNVTVPSGRSELERITDIDGDPLIYNSVIYVATYQGDVVALSEATGDMFWRRTKLSAYTSLAVDWRQIYVSDDKGHVWALDPDTAAARWRQEKLFNRKLSAPAVVGDYLVVGDFEGYLHWLSTKDGALVARTRVGNAPITAAPLLADGVLYALGDDGDLAAIKLPAN